MNDKTFIQQSWDSGPEWYLIPLSTGTSTPSGTVESHNCFKVHDLFTTATAYKELRVILNILME